MKLRMFLALCACAFCFVAGAETNEALLIQSLTGGYNVVDLNTRLVSFKGGVMISFGPAVLTADTAEIDQETGETFAAGNVVLQREGGQLWRGERLNYNFKSRIISGNTFRAGQPPYFVSGTNLITNPTNQTYTATNSSFTTDDHPNPNYRIRAKQIVIVPGKSIEAREALLYFGDVPVFYYPYYHRSLERHPNNYDFLAGYRSEWGPFLLNTYNWYWNRHIHTALNLDLRGERGIAGGPDVFWRDKTFGQGMLRYYYAHDEEPEDVRGFKTPDENRHRLLFTEQLVVRTNLNIKSVVAYQSDPFIVRDFFESEYHANAQPKSFFEIDQAWQNWDLNALAHFRVNDFQQTVERLPDVKLTGLRQQIAETPLFYESESSVGYFRHIFPVETNFYSPFRTNYFAAARADTYHQIVLPHTFFGWLNVIPRVGQRLTYYSQAHESGATTGEEFRSVFNTGAEVTWKASRVYRNVDNELLDVKGLRHTIEPSLNYVFIPGPSERPRDLPQFDTQLPTSRLLPIDFPDYNSIDSIDSQSVVRLGLRNKIQTKREDGVEDLLNWAVYTDWRLASYHGRSTFSDVYSDLDFRPRSWMTINSQTRYSVDRDTLNEANHTLTLQPGEDWSLSLGHRYRKDSVELGRGYDLIHATVYLRLNENWGLRTEHHISTRDGVLEYQVLHRLPRPAQLDGGTHLPRARKPLRGQ